MEMSNLSTIHHKRTLNLFSTYVIWFKGSKHSFSFTEPPYQVVFFGENLLSSHGTCKIDMRIISEQK